MRQFVHANRKIIYVIILAASRGNINLFGITRELAGIANDLGLTTNSHESVASQESMQLTPNATLNEGEKKVKRSDMSPCLIPNSIIDIRWQGQPLILSHRFPPISPSIVSYYTRQKICVNKNKQISFDVTSLSVRSHSSSYYASH